MVPWSQVPEDRGNVFSWSQVPEDRGNVFSWSQVQEDRGNVFSWSQVPEDRGNVFSWSQVQEDRGNVFSWSQVPEDRSDVVTWSQRTGVMCFHARGPPHFKEGATGRICPRHGASMLGRIHLLRPRAEELQATHLLQTRS
uniref:Uncharacterized protein n=1 Tax=Knipowitschia caucasica TaxID=637954 RepID=A0AAV2JDR1_KNICA